MIPRMAPGTAGRDNSGSCSSPPRNRTFAGMEDPFGHVTNEAPHTPAELRAELLDSARRAYAPLRKVFVQQPNESPTRPSILGAMVNARQEHALRLLLLAIALEPLDGLTLPPSRWAAMVSTPTKRCNPSQLGTAVSQLAERKLIQRNGTTRQVGLTPLREDGTGAAYIRPGSDGDDVGKGFFIIPHQLWTDGLIDQLRLPGLAMFLITLHDTHQNASFQVTLEQTPKWYGVSERTADRGYQELQRTGLLLTRPQTVRDRNAPNGLRTVTWRALADPYSKQSREDLQAHTRANALNARKNQK